MLFRLQLICLLLESCTELFYCLCSGVSECGVCHQFEKEVYETVSISEFEQVFCSTLTYVHLHLIAKQRRINTCLFKEFTPCMQVFCFIDLGTRIGITKSLQLLFETGKSAAFCAVAAWTIDWKIFQREARLI